MNFLSNVWAKLRAWFTPAHMDEVAHGVAVASDVAAAVVPVVAPAAAPAVAAGAVAANAVAKFADNAAKAANGDPSAPDLHTLTTQAVDALHAVKAVLPAAAPAPAPAK